VSLHITGFCCEIVVLMVGIQQVRRSFKETQDNQDLNQGNHLHNQLVFLCLSFSFTIVSFIGSITGMHKALKCWRRRLQQVIDDPGRDNVGLNERIFRTRTNGATEILCSTGMYDAKGIPCLSPDASDASEAWEVSECMVGPRDHCPRTLPGSRLESGASDPSNTGLSTSSLGH
jgi:hypothetical protein